MQRSVSHLLAWDLEHRCGIWKGPYSLDFFQCHAPPAGLVLDAGCGVGRYAVPLALRGYDVVGVDVSLTAARKLNTDRLRGSMDFRVACADICHLPFVENIFDVVVCFNAMQHLLRTERVLGIKEFRRVLKPGGILILEVAGREDMRAGGLMVEPFTYMRATGSVYHYFDKEELSELCSDYEIIEILETRLIKKLKGTDHVKHRISIVARMESDK